MSSKNPQKPPNPHDLFFRGAMNNAQLSDEFFQKHIPSNILKAIDKGSLKLTDGSFVDKNDISEQRTDVLYKATFHGVPGYIYFLLEHQRKPDRLMPLRILEYTLKIIRRELSLSPKGLFPLVFPCVIYNGKTSYCYTTDIFEMFYDPTLARKIFLKPFKLIDLSKMSYEDLRERPFKIISQKL